MRLGIITRHIGFNDGQGRVNWEIAAEAVRQGSEVILFGERADPRLSRDEKVVPILSQPPRWLPTRLLRDQLLALRTWSDLRNPLNRCDALLANGFVTWARCDVNAVHFVHTSWARSPHHPWRRQKNARSLYAIGYNLANSWLEKGAFRRSSRLVAVSNSVKRDLVNMGIPEDRITVVTNGVDTAEFRPGAGTRLRFGLPSNVLIGLFPGDLRTPRKNLDTVLRAIRSVPGFHLAVAGRHEGTPFPDLARRLGVDGRVHFLGFQTDMPALMRSVDLLVFPSRYEACSLVLLEALASGIPVLTANTAGGAELIGPDVGIVLGDSEDDQAIAAALRLLMEGSGERREAMGRRARTLAERHSWTAMAQKYIELLVEAAQSRRTYSNA